MAETFRTTPEDTDKMPSGIPYIVGNEAAERFSYYGMKAILMAFMTERITNAGGQPAPMTEAGATAWIHTFNMANYFFPIMGAIVADVFFGKYLTIMSLSMVYCLGHLVMAFLDAHTGIDPKWILGSGLFLIALGSGGIKPCVSAHVGDQFGKRNNHLLEKVYGWFYFSINFGSFFSTMLCPWLMENPKFGPAWAFGVPGVFMSLATLLFWVGRHKYAHIPAGGTASLREVASPEGKQALAGLIPLVLFMSVFFALYDQTASRWVAQAKLMDRWISLPFFGRLEINNSQIQAINPILVLVMIPLLSSFVYPLFGKAATPLRKIGTGLFLIAVSFAMSAIFQRWLDRGESVHFFWQAAAYVVLTAAEVICYGTTLEFSYSQAPPKMKSFVSGLFLLAISLGNLWTGLINKWIDGMRADSPWLKWFSGEYYYWFFTGCMLATGIVYLIWSPFYRGRTYVQGDELATPDVEPKTA
jgi:POT family proton-dependent oligopeptide transporter